MDRVSRVFEVPERDLRIVATEALAGGRRREVFYSTSHQTDALTILQRYSQRWSIEVTFRECKQHLGFQEMLATLRSESQQQYISQLPLPAPDLQKLRQAIQTLAQLNI